MHRYSEYLQLKITCENYYDLAVLVNLLGDNFACLVNNFVILYRISNSVKRERKSKVTDQVGVWFSWNLVFT